MTAGEQFLGLADLLPEPMLLVTVDGRIVAANPACGDRLGIPRPALAGQALTDLALTPADVVLDHLRLCAGSRQFLLGALALRTRGGERLDLRSEGALFAPAASGTPALVALRLQPRESAASKFIALNLKIDELSNEIARRTHVEQALREQRSWLEVTLSSIGDAVIATDRAGRIVFLNGVAEALTGWTRDEAAGIGIRDVFRIVNEQTRVEVESPVDRVLADGAIVGLANHTLLIARDGTERPIADSGAPIRDVEGRVFGVVLVFRDVSEQRQHERAERAARETAEAANRAKDEFLAMLSHELRTPLNAILGWVRMLQLGALDEEQRARAMDVIVRNADLQAVLIEDLLDVSRIISGKLRLRQESVQMKAVTEAALDAIGPAAGNRQVSLETDVPVVRELLGDPERLQQIAWNLLSNAVKFTPPGGRVQVRLTDSGPFVELRVSDTGEGFPPEFRPFLFDAFRQADVSLGRRHGGLGLGLTIVRHLVEGHGGTIDADSPGIGLGATFVVRLPVRSPAAEPPDSPAPA